MIHSFVRLLLRQRGDLIEIYIILSGKEKVYPNCFSALDKNLYSTTDYELKHKTSRSRVEPRRNFLSQRVVAHWNKLPETVVKAATVNSFKDRLDRCAEWSI